MTLVTVKWYHNHWLYYILQDYWRTSIVHSAVHFLSHPLSSSQDINTVYFVQRSPIHPPHTHTHTCIVIKCQDLIYSLPHGGCMQYTHIACIHHAVEDRLNHGTYSYTSWGGPEEEPEIKLPLSTFINHSAKCRMSIPQQYSWLPFCLIKGYQMFKKN